MRRSALADVAIMNHRVALTVSGTVQGVGFRPFAWTLARRLSLTGFVQNRVGSVAIEVEGSADAIASFARALEEEAPALARVTSVERAELPVRGSVDFRIEPSNGAGSLPTACAPDAPTCADCLREIFDPAERRHGHAFANCTSCGPRFTIVRGLPWDRATTTMADFAMCTRCRREYEDPSDRRFHAQPIACPECGPKLSVSVEDAARAIAEERIVAVKGIGGYHLACDATSAVAVEELRRRKRRDAKPFAVMVPTVADAEAIAHLDDAERHLLASAARPIVLARRRSREIAPRIAEAVAPGLDRVGVMLPYAPLHHLLVAAARRPIVMTSGNVTDEPIAYEDEDARKRLAGVADVFVTHDRAIHMRCEDSVAHVIEGAPAVIRRSRGHAPAALPLPCALEQETVALGGHLKAVFAFGRGAEAMLGHHIGDLESFEAWRSYRHAFRHLRDLLAAKPARVVHDLHPDYATTQYAEELGREGLERIAVQHHEAHVAACFADAGIADRAIGVAFDGAGWGRDGTIWGGEVFTGTAGALERVAHLRTITLPGGDRAARDPWRCAVAHLVDAEIDPRSVLGRDVVGDAELALFARVAREGLVSARTSSAGRLFDAVAAMTGIRTHARHEAHAAMELQCLAERASEEHDDELYPFADLDTRHVVRAVVEDVARGTANQIVARRFHATLANGVADVCARIHAAGGVASDVALSGGVFANALLSRLTARRLDGHGLRARFCRSIPTNDGGLAYGQLAIVAARDGGTR